MMTRSNAFPEFFAAALFVMLGMSFDLHAAFLPSWMHWGSGLAFVALIFLAWSGAHVNPAVSWQMAMTGKLSMQALLPYVVVQMLGGAVGLLIVSWRETGNVTALADDFIVRPHAGTSLGAVFLAEALGYLALGLAIALSPRVETWAKWLLIGGGLTLGVYVVGPFSGGSLNPMRALVPFLLAPHAWGDWELVKLTLVAYVLGPMVGATVAGVATWKLRRAANPA